MRTPTLVAVLWFAACGGSPPIVQPSTPMSADDHAVAANDHEQLALDHDRQANEAGVSTTAAYNCGDTVLADQVTSGGERLVDMVPCFNAQDEAAEDQRELATKERTEAAHERDAAGRLVSAEVQACAGISPRERGHSAFVHQHDIASVTPYTADGKVEGARVRFRAVRHLDVSWLRASIACHEAQFVAAGKDPKLMSYDPTLVDGAHVLVDPRKDGDIEVTISSTDDAAAAVILARAQDLMASPTASLR